MWQSNTYRGVPRPFWDSTLSPIVGSPLDVSLSSWIVRNLILISFTGHSGSQPNLSPCGSQSSDVVLQTPRLRLQGSGTSIIWTKSLLNLYTFIWSLCSTSPFVVLRHPRFLVGMRWQQFSDAAKGRERERHCRVEPR